MLFKEALGYVISEYRKDKGLTLRQMMNQNKAIISHNYLWEIEKGRKEVSSVLLREVAKAMNTDTAELVIKVGIVMAGGIPDYLPKELDELSVNL